MVSTSGPLATKMTHATIGPLFFFFFLVAVLKSADQTIHVFLVLIYPDRELFVRLLLENVINDPELADVHAEWQDQHDKQDLKLLVLQCPAQNPLAEREQERLRNKLKEQQLDR